MWSTVASSRNMFTSSISGMAWIFRVPFTEFQREDVLELHAILRSLAIQCFRRHLWDHNHRRVMRSKGQSSRFHRRWSKLGGPSLDGLERSGGGELDQDDEPARAQ